jgi:hypothetical protein
LRLVGQLPHQASQRHRGVVHKPARREAGGAAGGAGRC